MQEEDATRRAPALPARRPKGGSGGSQDLPKRYSDVGTPDYIAPEVLLGSGHSFQVDYWAMGCILFEFLVGFPPFCGETLGDVFQHVTSRDIQWPPPEELFQPIPPSCHELIEGLLVLDPKKRLGAGGADAVKASTLFSEDYPPNSPAIDWHSLRDTEALWIPDEASSTDTRYFASAEDYEGMADASGKELVDMTPEAAEDKMTLQEMTGIDILDMLQDGFDIDEPEDPLECSAFLNFSSKNIAALQELTLMGAEKTLRESTPKSSPKKSDEATDGEGSEGSAASPPTRNIRGRQPSALERESGSLISAKANSLFDKLLEQ